MTNPHDCTVAEPLLEAEAVNGECFGFVRSHGEAFPEGAWFERWTGACLQTTTRRLYMALCAEIEEWLFGAGYFVTQRKTKHGYTVSIARDGDREGKHWRADRRLNALVSAALALKER